jgi:hypothetical protein
LSRSVRLPKALVPLREMIARELLDVMLRVAWPLAQEIAALAYRRPKPKPRWRFGATQAKSPIDERRPSTDILASGR